MIIPSKELYVLGKGFEELVGKKLDQFNTPAEMEEAVEEKLGRKLISISVNPEKMRKQSQQIIEQSRLLLHNL